MSKQLQRLILLILTPLMIVSLAGCEQLRNSIPFLQDTPVSLETTATPSPTPSFPVEGNETVTPMENEVNQITLWLPPEFDPENGSPEGDLLNHQLQTFSEDHPEVTINVRIKATSGSGGLLDSLTTASLAATSVLPGVLILPRSDFETAARDGLLMPIELESLQSVPSEWFPYADELTMVKSIRYGLPFAGDALCLAYKPLQVAYPPTLWQEVTRLESSVLAFPAADPQGLMALLLYMDDQGGFGQDESTVLLDEVSLQHSLLVLSEGANTNVFPFWLTDYTTFDQPWQALQDSNAAYAAIWTSIYLAEKPENTTITRLPSTSDQPFTLADGWVLAFPQTSPEQFALYQTLAQYLVDVKFQSAWTEAAGLLPASEAVLSGWKNTEVSGILLEIAQSAHAVPSNLVTSKVNPLFTQATIEMIRKQTSYIESSNKILKALSE